jgi:hypothetical protein
MTSNKWDEWQSRMEMGTVRVRERVREMKRLRGREMTITSFH